MKDAHLEWCRPWTETQPTLRLNHRDSVCSLPIVHVPSASWTIIHCSAYWRTRPPSERRTCHLTACCRLHRTPPHCNILQTSGLRQTPPPVEWSGGDRPLHGTWWEFGGWGGGCSPWVCLQRDHWKWPSGMGAMHCHADKSLRVGGAAAVHPDHPLKYQPELNRDKRLGRTSVNWMSTSDSGGGSVTEKKKIKLMQSAMYERGVGPHKLNRKILPEGDSYEALSSDFVNKVSVKNKNF